MTVEVRGRNLEVLIAEWDICPHGDMRDRRSLCVERVTEKLLSIQMKTSRNYSLNAEFLHILQVLILTRENAENLANLVFDREGPEKILVWPLDTLVREFHHF